MENPTLSIMGTNGSGKTTITEQFLEHEWLGNATYVNLDIIAQEKFGGWDNKESFVKAANYAQEIRENCIKNKQSLVFETVFSTDEKIKFVKKALEAGFFIRFFFIATEDPEINASRIASRIMKGGHNVPLDKIISRYYKSIVNCARVINLVDRLVYDNSVDGRSPKLVFRVENNKGNQVLKKYEILPNWIKPLINCAKTLKQSK
ncbi:zeta toxin family protein [Bathymodiolus thermophilus thioautotrophic gill symbiont]|uniref:AAA family ATPase n=1 Tax=Bathymodiolus thermophilus thioautotrophic gill symbiont TaxID=2360 RepID=A0A1J5UN52_9GAMM|nr:zeta toxin family protein [Bathymodiolus thermophilus thioautotrophic gill symbiont]OIR25655.1 AAA family ATPase [Bathymodiolus thermophilus thioautotrophic gill symbiont]